MQARATCGGSAGGAKAAPLAAAARHSAPLHDVEQGRAALFWVDGRRAAVIGDHNGLLIEHESRSWWPAQRLRGGAGVVQRFVPYSEILSCRYRPTRRACPSFSRCQRQQQHCLELQVLRRHPSKPWQWSLATLALSAEEPQLVKRWAAQVQQRLDALTHRPRRLLVFVNPFGGRRTAKRTWERVAAPILAAAGAQCEVLETTHQAHAQQAVAGLGLQQLQQLDGLVAVGGDGLWNELLTAVLQHTHLAAAMQLRLAHIPAGSTDAVACTLHGTRDAITATLHIALGDCTALDVGRLVTLPPAPAAAQGEGSTHASAAEQAARAATGTSAAATASAAFFAGHGAAAGAPGAESPAACAAAAAAAGTSVGSHTELLFDPAAVSSSPAESASQPAAAGGRTNNAGASESDSRQHAAQRRQQQRRREAKQRRQQRPRLQQPERDGPSAAAPQLRHFVCVASWGFLGDVLATSERLRWLGPARYDVAGVLRFLLLRRYAATVWFKPASSAEDDDDAVVTQEQLMAAQHHAQHAPRPRCGGGGGGGFAGPLLVTPAAAAPLPHQQRPGQGVVLLPAPARDADSPHSHCGGSSLGDPSSRRSSLDLSCGLASPSSLLAESPAPAGGGSGQQPPAGSAKAVSFQPLPLAATVVHASACSISSAASSAAARSATPVPALAPASAAPSRASSVLSGSGSSSSRCHSRCSRCSAAALHHSSSRQSFAAEAADADGPGAAANAPPCDAGTPPPGEGWRCVDGQFACIMVAVTSCISDKSRAGLLPGAHLADGRLALVLVGPCGRLAFLRFLSRLATRGLEPGALPAFVRVEHASAVQVRAHGRLSSWNVDGELLRAPAVGFGVHAGLVDVFGRGVELG